ncbi:ANTAR domain-containing protein [Pseudonocardia sp. ICBG1293]|uniref:ANTAR domain-containing protein n=1 Tax=Pseudonocardia sp. ICBG1293 TaxID=2844382 RepID=UPI001CCF3E69|nr:ANTAR domain-containing protein [Pseudonocardia sp. ICBG1293]
METQELHSVLRAQAELLLGEPGSARAPAQQYARICDGLVQAVPRARWATLATRDRSGLRCLGATDERTPELARVMADCGHGPCLDAIAAGSATEVVVDDVTAAGDRWPVFAPAAARAGMRSVLCRAMAPGDRPIGELTVWSDEVGAFGDERSRTIMAVLAAQAAVAVSGAQQAENLARALRSRDVIGRAKGILMERFQLGDDGAFQLLVRSSQDLNMKLGEVATVLCREAEERAAPVPRARSGPDSG